MIVVDMIIEVDSYSGIECPAYDVASPLIQENLMEEEDRRLVERINNQIRLSSTDTNSHTSENKQRLIEKSYSDREL